MDSSYLSRVKGPLSNISNLFVHSDEALNSGRSAINNDDLSDSDSSIASGFDGELDRIGRLPSFNTIFSVETPRLMSLDHYHWLIKRYLFPWGEPQGIVPAVEPADPPAIEPVIQDEHAEITRTSAVKPKMHLRKISNAKEYKLLSEPELRQKIMDISAMGLPDRERDRMVQQLMTDNYYRIRGLKLEEYNEGSSDKKSKTDLLDKAHRELEAHDEGAKPTFTESGTYGCEHYARACKIQCNTCYKFYTCRLCHDENEPDHQLERGVSEVVLCMQCGVVQTPSQLCNNCGQKFGEYYCEICKLWENNELGDKPIYHCAECGICRVGEGLGIDFIHCSTCNVCMSQELEDNHKCIEHSTECDCPICGEFMFTSRETVVFMKCGHSIHQKCFDRHTRTSYKCPTCARSIINMAAQFRILDNEIENTPMPEPFCDWRSIVVCNDCSAKSSIPFHILGLKCDNCGSYNTAQGRLVKPGGEDGDTAEIQRGLQQVMTATGDTGEEDGDFSSDGSDIL